MGCSDFLLSMKERNTNNDKDVDTHGGGEAEVKRTVGVSGGECVSPVSV